MGDFTWLDEYKSQTKFISKPVTIQLLTKQDPRCLQRLLRRVSNIQYLRDWQQTKGVNDC
jgi:uncharacterized membrane protein YbaN (DUF454 family)